MKGLGGEFLHDVLDQDEEIGVDVLDQVTQVRDHDGLFILGFDVTYDGDGHHLDDERLAEVLLYDLILEDFLKGICIRIDGDFIHGLRRGLIPGGASPTTPHIILSGHLTHQNDWVS